MLRPRSAALASALVVMFTVAVCNAGAGPATKAQEWVPLVDGDRAVFAVTKSRSVVIDDQPPRETKVEESITDETRAAGDRFEMGTTIVSQGGPGGPRTGRLTMSLSSDARGLYLHSMAMATEPATAAETSRYDPPLLLLKLPAEVGAKWEVGRLKLGGIVQDWSSEVEAFEDVTVPAGSYAGCLKVRSRIKISGKMPVAGGEAVIESGSIEMTDWYAPGVGAIKQVQTMRQTLLIPGDRKASAVETKEKLRQPAAAKP